MSQPRHAERGVPTMELRGCLPTATARARCCGDAGWRRQKERCRECLCIAKLPVNCYERSLFTEKGAQCRHSPTRTALGGGKAGCPPKTPEGLCSNRSSSPSTSSQSCCYKVVLRVETRLYGLHPKYGKEYGYPVKMPTLGPNKTLRKTS